MLGMPSQMTTAQGIDPLVDLVRRRTWAGWIDVLILAALGVILSLVSGNGHIGSWTTTDNVGFATQHHGFSFNLPGVWLVAWLVIVLLYYFMSELRTGQTIGKWALGLQVVTLDGRRLDVRPVLLRTLGRIIDVLPVFYLVGWIAMRGPRRPPQRLGDRFAGTTVVRCDARTPAHDNLVTPTES